MNSLITSHWQVPRKCDMYEETMNPEIQELSEVHNSYSPEHLLLVIASHRIQKSMKFTHPFGVDESIANTRIKAPRELVARIGRRDLLYVSIVNSHQQFGTQRAVVHVPSPHEQCPQKLQNHIVQADVPADHPGQLLNNVSLSTGLW